MRCASKQPPKKQKESLVNFSHFIYVSHETFWHLYKSEFAYNARDLIAKVGNDFTYARDSDMAHAIRQKVIFRFVVCLSIGWLVGWCLHQFHLSTEWQNGSIFSVFVFALCKSSFDERENRMPVSLLAGICEICQRWWFADTNTNHSHMFHSHMYATGATLSTWIEMYTHYTLRIKRNEMKWSKMRWDEDIRRTVLQQIRRPILCIGECEPWWTAHTHTHICTRLPVLTHQFSKSQLFVFYLNNAWR